MQARKVRYPGVPHLPRRPEMSYTAQEVSAVFDILQARSRTLTTPYQYSVTQSYRTAAVLRPGYEVAQNEDGR